MYIQTRRERAEQQQQLGALKMISPRMAVASFAPQVKLSVPARMPAPLPAARPAPLAMARPSAIASFGRQYGASDARAEADRKAAILAAQPKSAHNIARDEAQRMYETLLRSGRSHAEAVAIMASQGKKLMTF